MAEVAVVMVGDAAKLLAENEKLIRKQAQLEERLRKNQEQSKAAAEAARKEAHAKSELMEVQRRAKAVIEATATPAERYNAKLREAESLERKGAISSEVLARRKRQLKEELRAATTSQSAFNAQMQNAASSVETVTSMAAAYVGVQAAVTAVTGSLQQQIDLQKESLELVVKTGKAQQDAIKNLTGLSEEQKRQALDSANEIQQQTGFAGRDKLVEAIGAGFSASGDIEATKDAVAAAAELSRLTPEAVAGISSGALDIRRGSGVDDAEANLGFLLQAGSFARIEDPTLLAKNLAPAVGASSTIFAGGDQQQVAKETAAIFAALSRAATDKTGESTTTAAVQFNQQLAEFFTDLPTKIQTATNEITKLEADAQVTQREQLAISEAELQVREIERKISQQGAPRNEADQLAADKLQLDLEDARLRVDEAKAKSTLTQEEDQRLAALKKQREELQAVQAPTTPLEAVQLLQQNEALRTEFTSTLTGEARFKDAFKALLDASSAIAGEAAATAGQLKFDRSTFDETVGQLGGLTPEIAIAGIRAGAQADSEIAKTDPNRAAVGLINEIATDVLPQVRSGGFAGAVQSVVGAANEAVVPSIFNDPQSLAEFRIGQFEARKSALEAGGITAEEAPLVKLLEQSIERVNAILATLDNKLGGAADKLGAAGDKLNLPPGVRPMLGRSPGPNSAPITDRARAQANQGG